MRVIGESTVQPFTRYVLESGAGYEAMHPTAVLQLVHQWSQLAMSSIRCDVSLRSLLQKQYHPNAGTSLVVR